MAYRLDVSREEYRDDYANGQESGELWQIYARNQLVSCLSSTLKDAEKYKVTRSEETSDETWLSHNAILVTSPRGSGKTVFLRNSKHMWNSSQQGKEEGGKLFFLNVIDPTMLMDNDSFANVIIAQIYQAVSEHFNKKANICSKARDKFHHSLKRLSDSMGKSSEFDGSMGIDKILKYSSGIQVENKFHNFVESAIAVLGCSAIVVLIDDVDMALENAFEVVDEVRRYLGCPYIIPIVSGDLKLYEHMTQVRFDESAYNNNCRDQNLRQDGIQLSSDLTTAYLTKVFPSHTRISLFSIENLLSQMEIIESDSENSTSNSRVLYSVYRERLLDKFYYLCHNRDSRKEQFTPKSARELTQLVRTIKPSELKNVEQNDAQAMSLYIKYKGWAAQQKQGDAFAHADCFVSISHDKKNAFDIQRLLAFNIKEQSDLVLYPWAKYNVFDSQMDALKMLPQNGGKEVKNEQLLNTFFNKNSKILKPMPPLEFLVHDLFIPKGISQEGGDVQVTIPKEIFPKILSASNYCESDSSVDIEYSVGNVLLDIYTEGELYSTLNNTKRYVLFSRAFELLVYSFINGNDDVSFDVIDGVLRKKPFYSIINLVDTKISIEGEEEDFKGDIAKGETSLAIFGEIAKWKSNNSDVLSTFDSTRLVPIFSYIFNSVFTAMNVIKANYSSSTARGYKNEHLSDMVLRFKYNILNSVLRAGIYGEAIYANVLIGAKSETVRDASEIASRDKTYTRNMAVIKEEIKRFDKVDPDRVQNLKSVLSLHDSIEQHPIFSILSDDCGVFNPIFRLGSASRQKHKKLIFNLPSESKAEPVNVENHSIKVSSKPYVQRVNLSKVKTGMALQELGTSRDEVEFILNKFVRKRISSESSIRDDIVDNLGSIDLQDAIRSIQSALNSDFESNRAFMKLNDRYKNLLKVIYSLGKPDAEN